MKNANEIEEQEENKEVELLQETIKLFSQVAPEIYKTLKSHEKYDEIEIESNLFRISIFENENKLLSFCVAPLAIETIEKVKDAEKQHCPAYSPIKIESFKCFETMKNAVANAINEFLA